MKKNIWGTFVICLVIILTSNILNCNLIDPLKFKAIRFPIVAVLIAAILIKKKDLNTQKMFLKKDIKWLMIVPCFSWISAAIVWGQSPIFSFVCCIYIYILFLYFFCFVYRIPVYTIIKIFSIFTLIVFVIQIYDQFITTPPFLFGGMEGESGWIKRGFVYRITILINISTFILFYYYEKLLRGENKYISLLFVIVCLMLTYFSCTRQIIVSTFVALVYMSFVNMRHRRTVIVFGVMIILLLQYGGTLFEDLIELSQHQKEDGSFGGRNDSYIFYIDKIFTEPLTFLFGSGNAYDGDYGRQMAQWTDVKKYIIVDIGHIGQFFLYGIGYIIIYFYMQYKLMVKYRKFLPSYIYAYLIFINIIGFMIAPLARMQQVCSFALIMYIIDRKLAQANSSAIKRITR